MNLMVSKAGFMLNEWLISRGLRLGLLLYTV